MSNNEIGKIYERPWGTYETLTLTAHFQIKILTIYPNGRLSLQKHSKRSEHWVVVTGEPTLTLGEESKVYRPNDHLFIPREAVHRIENFTSSPCQIVEVQIGDYLGEDDIIRLEDIYNR